MGRFGKESFDASFSIRSSWKENEISEIALEAFGEENLRVDQVVPCFVPVLSSNVIHFSLLHLL